MRQKPRKIARYVPLAALAGVLALAGGRRASAQTATLQHGSGAAAAASSNQYVGNATCAMCHQELTSQMAGNPHHKIALLEGHAGHTCESCHGPGWAHVDGGGDITKIRHFDVLTPSQIDATCLSCHAQTHPNFLRSPHARAGVSCLSCHSIHKAEPETTLLVAAQPLLCYRCHSDIKPSFSMPFHHRVNEGLMQCTDCHDVHGTFQANNLRNTVDQNMVCVKCHIDVRGPFVYEHAPVKAEGCMGCHTPHGSVNARLLNMPNINVLCNQCHSQVAADAVHGMNAGSSDSIPCTTCHTYIHGSNMDEAFLR